MNEIPDCPIINYCHCYPDQEREANDRGCSMCVCGDTEKALRGWMSGRITAPMTPEQREWCLSEIGSVEGYDRADYEGETDAGLARNVIGAWMDYCRDKGSL